MSDKELLGLIYKKHVAVGFIIELVEGDWGGVQEYNDFIGLPKYFLSEDEFNEIVKGINR